MMLIKLQLRNRYNKQEATCILKLNVIMKLTQKQ
jgi:hypothetical protein